jgi:predicted transglutaminase-like cysteine proteinase
MMPIMRRASAMLLCGLIASAVFNAEADSTASSASMFPGWKAISSTNWDFKASGVQSWHQMLARWSDGKPCDSDTCSSTGWTAMVAQVKAAGDVIAQMKAANVLINDPALHPYKEDIANWKVADYWETPTSFSRCRAIRKTSPLRSTSC